MPAHMVFQVSLEEELVDDTSSHDVKGRDVFVRARGLIVTRPLPPRRDPEVCLCSVPCLSCIGLAECVTTSKLWIKAFVYHH